MNNTIQNDDVLRDDRLEDSEIANVLSSLKLSEFKKTNEPNLEPDQSFKPRSLMEIAQSAHKEIKKNDNESDKNETEGSVLKASEGLSSSEDQSSLGNQELDENLIEDKVDSAGGDIQSETTKTVSDLDLDSENSKDQFNQQVKSEDKEEEKNVLTSEKSGTSEALSVGVETAKQAFDRGYGEGEKAGRLSAASELKANIEARSRRAFEDKVTSLEAAIESLTKFEVSQVNSLSEKIRENHFGSDIQARWVCD